METYESKFVRKLEITPVFTCDICGYNSKGKDKVKNQYLFSSDVIGVVRDVFGLSIKYHACSPDCHMRKKEFAEKKKQQFIDNERSYATYVSWARGIRLIRS